MHWYRSLIAGQLSRNAFSCGIYGRENGTKRILSPSPLILSSVRITPPQLIALSFIYHRRHIILADVSVIDRLKRY